MPSVALVNLYLKNKTSNTHHCNPEDYVFIYEAVEVLVEEEEARAYEGCVLEVQLTLCHVCNLQRCRGTQGVKYITLHVLPDENKQYTITDLKSYELHLQHHMNVPPTYWRS